MFLLSAAAVLLVSLLTVLEILRRGGRRDTDLLAAQLRAPAMEASSDRAPGTDGFSFAGVEATTRRRVEELAAAGRRMQAIELLRSATGCRLAEAKAVVDRLPRGRRTARTAPRMASGPRPAQFPPGYDLDPGRTAEPASGVSRAETAHQLLHQVRELAQGGHTAAAVRLLRDVTGMGPRDAEEAVGRLTAQPPE